MSAENTGPASWHPLDENGYAELRVNGKRITTFPSYPGAEEAAQRINQALAPPSATAPRAPDAGVVNKAMARYCIANDINRLSDEAERAFKAGVCLARLAPAAGQDDAGERDHAG